MDSSTHFRAMARNNAWSNDRLLHACAELTRAELEEKRTSFFPSLLLTLQHILQVDWYYVGELHGTGKGYAEWRDRAAPTEIAALAGAQAESDRRLVRFCDGLDEAALARDIGLDRGEEGVFQEALRAVLSHLFMHQIHHRGQVHAMLAGTRVAPPQLDEFFLAYDEPRRRAEIARLGL